MTTRVTEGARRERHGNQGSVLETRDNSENTVLYINLLLYASSDPHVPPSGK